MVFWWGTSYFDDISRYLIFNLGRFFKDEYSAMVCRLPHLRITMAWSWPFKFMSQSFFWIWSSPQSQMTHQIALIFLGGFSELGSKMCTPPWLLMKTCMTWGILLFLGNIKILSVCKLENFCPVLQCGLHHDLHKPIFCIFNLHFGSFLQD